MFYIQSVTCLTPPTEAKH